MTTVSSLVDSSLRLLRAIDSGVSASSSELTDAVNALNSMLSGWSTGPNKIFVVTRESFPLVVGTKEYTIGPGADFDTTRPVRLLDAFIRNDITDYPVRIIQASNYAQIPLKNTIAWVYKLYYERDYPVGKIILDYVPDTAFDLHLYSHKEFSEYNTDGADVISLPPGYERALKYNLAVEIAPEYKPDVPPLVMKIAEDSLRDIKRVNAQPVQAINTNPISKRSDKGRSYDISGDTYVCR